VAAVVPVVTTGVASAETVMEEAELPERIMSAVVAAPVTVSVALTAGLQVEPAVQLTTAAAAAAADLPAVVPVLLHPVAVLRQPELLVMEEHPTSLPAAVQQVAAAVDTTAAAAQPEQTAEPVRAAEVHPGRDHFQILISSLVLKPETDKW
jgi:hypothetical protein